MIGIPLGLLVGNATEWFTHKYVLHNMGKKKNSFWKFHWSEHHKTARKNDFYDKDYEKPLLESIIQMNAQGKEALALIGASIVHLPLFPIFPFYTSTLWYCAWNYYRKHKKAHLNPEWAKKNLSWHYAHHMGDQQKSFCVTQPFFDYVMNTTQQWSS